LKPISIKWSREELKAYDNVGIKEQDERGEREKAMQAAAQKAREEKENEAIIEMYKDNVPSNKIALCLNIREEKVLKIITNHINK